MQEEVDDVKVALDGCDDIIVWPKLGRVVGPACVHSDVFAEANPPYKSPII